MNQNKEKRIHLNKYLDERGRKLNKSKDVTHVVIANETGEGDKDIEDFWTSLKKVMGDMLVLQGSQRDTPPPPGPVPPHAPMRDWLTREIDTAGLDPADFHRGANSAMQKIAETIVGEGSNRHVEVATEALGRLQSPSVSHKAGVSLVRDAVQNVGLDTFTRATRDAGK